MNFYEKQILKAKIKIARAAGSVDGLIWSLSLEEFNKEGAVKAAIEVREVLNELLRMSETPDALDELRHARENLDVK